MKLRIYRGSAKATDSFRDLNLSFNYSCGLLRLRVKSDWSQNTINIPEVILRRSWFYRFHCNKVQVDLYKDDLPSPQLFSSEFQRWKIMVQNGRIAADSCASSLKACDPDDFPNLYMLLKIAATLPVTTCECERSISTMRRLNNYMRCTMGESRLSSLALMHIKYDMPVNLEEIVNLFEGLHPRMMQFASLLYE